MGIDGYQTYHGYHVITYANAKSLLSTLKLIYTYLPYMLTYIYMKITYMYISAIFQI